MTFARFRTEAAATLHLGTPLIAAQLAQVSMGFVDAVMAGRLSPQDLAAVAVGANLFWPIALAFMGMLMAVSPTVAHHFGAGRRQAIGHTVRQGLWMAGAVGVCGLIAVRSSPLLLGLVGISSELIPTTTGFLHAISWGIPGLCIYQTLRSYSEGTTMTRPVMYTSITGLVANVIGDYIFMYGKFGLPRMGAVGCGVASAIVMWMNAGMLSLYILMHRHYKPDGAFSRFEGPHWPEITALARLGIPMSLGLFMEASLFGAVALLMGTLGTIIVAGHQIALNVASITFMIPLGIGMAITVRVGQAMGRHDVDGARIAGFVGISLAGAFMALAGICILLFPESIAGIYTQDPAVRKMAVTLLFMAAIFQVSDGLQVSGLGALRGLKDTKVPMYITVIAYWIVGMPLGYMLGITLNGGARAMWIGIICGLTAAAILLNTRFYLVTRVRTHAASTTERVV
jgi:MATE family multidrug resistance protein